MLTMQGIDSRLSEERNELAAFIALLEREQSLLTSNDASPLMELAEAKSRSTGRLMSLIAARRNFMQADGGTDMDSWLGRKMPGALAAWHEILRMAEQAQHLNSVNGELIQVRLRHNQQALSVLHNASSDSAGLYGRDGQPNISNSPRRILGTV